MNSKVLFKWWLLSLLIMTMIVVASVNWIDVPIARFFFKGSGKVAGLAHIFGSSVMVACEVALMLSIAVIRLMRGSIPDYANVIFLACCASLLAFAANDYVLKELFGRYGPYTFFGGSNVRDFNFLKGDMFSVFPSGHMVISTAFAAMIIRQYPRVWPVLTILLCAGAAALLVGDWHFLSDIISGAFVGSTAGLLAAELWRQHLRKLRT